MKIKLPRYERCENLYLLCNGKKKNEREIPTSETKIVGKFWGALLEADTKRAALVFQ